jgi:hypothetical protein
MFYVSMDSLIKYLLIIMALLFINSVQVYAQSSNSEKQIPAVKTAVNNYMKIYPKSRLKDLYKSFFQDRYGPGHLINDTAAAGRYLLKELDSYTAVSGEIAEPTGWRHNFYRVNLSVIKEGLVPYDLFLDAFVCSANGIKAIPVEEWRKEWIQIEKIIRSMELSLPFCDDDRNEIEQRLKEGNYAGHHSEAFNEAYTPHYRVIGRKIFEEEILPLLEQNRKRTNNNE